MTFTDEQQSGLVMPQGGVYPVGNVFVAAAITLVEPLAELTRDLGADQGEHQAPLQINYFTQQFY